MCPMCNVQCVNLIILVTIISFYTGNATLAESTSVLFSKNYQASEVNPQICHLPLE